MFGEGSWNEQENYLQIIMHIEIEVKTCKLSPKRRGKNETAAEMLQEEAVCKFSLRYTDIHGD